jgi:hypothetical protein
MRPIRIPAAALLSLLLSLALGGCSADREVRRDPITPFPDPYTSPVSSAVLWTLPKCQTDDDCAKNTAGAPGAWSCVRGTCCALSSQPRTRQSADRKLSRVESERLLPATAAR